MKAPIASNAKDCAIGASGNLGFSNKILTEKADKSADYAVLCDIAIGAFIGFHGQK